MVGKQEVRGDEKAGCAERENVGGGEEDGGKSVGLSVGRSSLGGGGGDHLEFSVFPFQSSMVLHCTFL